MKNVINLVRPFWNPSAWILIIIGALLFASHARFTQGYFFNFPELASLIEVAGGLMMVTGFNIAVSMVYWPNTDTGKLLTAVYAGNTAAGIVLAGLKVFNGLTLLAYAIWGALTLAGGVK